METDTGRVHYLDWGGDGPQVHLLHANGFCAGTYTPMVEYFRDWFHVVASDVRGHGGSSNAAQLPVRHWKVFSDDLKQVVTHAMQPPVIGIGHSLGAVTTLIAAVQHPHLFRAIILMDPVIFSRRILWLIRIFRAVGLMWLFPLARGARRRKAVFENKTAAFKRFAAGRGIFKTWSKDFIDAYLECGLLEKDEETAVLQCDPELEAQIFESVPVDAWSYARRVQCPVLVMRGEMSDTFQAGPAERLGSVVSDYELRTIKGTGHFLPMERPDACAGEILAYLDRRGLC